MKLNNALFDINWLHIVDWDWGKRYTVFLYVSVLVFLYVVWMRGYKHLFSRQCSSRGFIFFKFCLESWAQQECFKHVKCRQKQIKSKMHSWAPGSYNVPVWGKLNENLWVLWILELYFLMIRNLALSDWLRWLL